MDSGHDNFDDIYCTGNTLILIAAFVNTLLISMMLFFHIRTNYHNLSFIELMTKVKTSMLILMIILQITVVIRYGFNIGNENLYDFILIGSNFVS